MKNINLQQIFYFKITMKCTSFSQAARLAYTTQSTISKNISLLEKIIGEPLFIRQKKGILPTQRALILNLELTDIYEKIDALFYKHSYNQNHFTIGFCQNISFATAIPNFFSLFTAESLFKDADIKLHCYENNDIIDGVINGSIDLGFILSDTTISNPNIKLHTIVSAVPQIFYSTNCPLSKVRNLSVNDFAGFPFVTTKYLIKQNDYRMINLLPFTPARIEIVESYNDIPIYLATGLYITLLRPYVSLASEKTIKRYKLPNHYNLSQGINMIWFNSNKNKYLKKILSHIVVTV